MSFGWKGCFSKWNFYFNPEGVFLLQKAVNLLRGFVRVSVECPFPESFINLCARNGIAFWGAERVGALRIDATIPAKNLTQAEGLALRLGGGLTPLEQRGVLFFLERFKKRYILIAGFVLCLAALLISNRYIWEFTVEGNAALSDEEILQALQECGITIGSPGSAVDIETLRCRMLLKLDKLLWVSINVTGSRAVVVVRERIDKPDIIDRTAPVNIVAEKAGLITAMEALSGSAQVSPGDTVHQGELLVSGLIDSARLGVRLVNARADVTARTWPEFHAVTPTGAVGKRYTGRSKTRSALVLGSKRVNLHRNSSQPYAMCDKMTETSVLRLSPTAVFPLALVRETYTEYQPVAYRLDETVAEDALRTALEETLRADVKRGEILSEKFTFQTAPGLATAVLTAECLERIDGSRKIEISEVLEFP
jgi:similar to stage IV sporulation protein